MEVEPGLLTLSKKVTRVGLVFDPFLLISMSPPLVMSFVPRLGLPSPPGHGALVIQT